MSNRYEMRFGGTCGQGMMLLGDVLAYAAGINSDKEIVLTKSYGPEARGSACRSELITDDTMISYPVVSRPDFLLALSQMACTQYTKDLAEDGVVLIDSDLVKEVPENAKTVYRLPITKIAEEATGKTLCANMVALGAIAILSRCASEDAVYDAMLHTLPAKILEINKVAFAAGAKAAKELLQ